ncbi:hypothetical protein [Natrinema gelatinilyticum]|nr:hypothetical protein [Natrinema gelatinilyticum]
MVDAETDGNDQDAAPGAVPMVFRRGRSVNSVLGPDADVFERDCGNEDD